MPDTTETKSPALHPVRGKSCLVTGGHGFIGSALVKALVRDGARVRTFDNDWRGSSRRLAGIEKEVEAVVGDIRDPASVRRATEGIDCVCHLAFINGTKFFYSQPELVLEVAVKGMANVIDGCIANHVPWLILASSSEVYQTPPSIPTNESVPLSIPDPLNPRYSYGVGKLVSEFMAINFGRKHFERVSIFRPHNVYGPDMGTDHVIPELALRLDQLRQTTSGPLQVQVHGTGQERRSFVYIDDLVDGVMLVINRGEHLGIYHIGTQEEVTIEHLAKVMGDYFGREVVVVAGETDRGSTRRRCPDISKMRALGYEPRISLREGLAKTLEWYCGHLNPKYVQMQSD